MEHAEILVPQREADAPASPVPERAALWNQAEQAEHRRDSRVAREYQFLLPHELPRAAQIALAQRFAQDIADRYGGAVDLAVHRPPAGGDERNIHAHVLSTTRVYTPEGLGAKTSLEISDTKRRERGLPPMSIEYTQIRARLADYTNEALREHGLEARVDHRSLLERGITRQPISYSRWEYDRVRQNGMGVELGEPLPAQPDAGQATLREGKSAEASSISLEQRRQAALDAWRVHRQQEANLPPVEREREARERSAEPGRLNDRDYER